MTKSAQIMALHKRGKTTREIAMAVYGLAPDPTRQVIDRKMAYVRVVLRQRKGQGTSPANTRYLISKGYKKTWQRNKERYHNDPAYRAKYRSRQRRRYAARVDSDPQYVERRRAYMRSWMKSRRARNESAISFG